METENPEKSEVKRKVSFDMPIEPNRRRPSKPSEVALKFILLVISF